MVKREKNGKKFKWVKPTVEKGAGGVWYQMSCPDGHLIRFIRRGGVTDARRLKRVKCFQCGNNGEKPE
jgi:hypothetical protein